MANVDRLIKIATRRVEQGTVSKDKATLATGLSILKNKLGLSAEDIANQTGLGEDDVEDVVFGVNTPDFTQNAEKITKLLAKRTSDVIRGGERVN